MVAHERSQRARTDRTAKLDGRLSIVRSRSRRVGRGVLTTSELAKDFLDDLVDPLALVHPFLVLRRDHLGEQSK